MNNQISSDEAIEAILYTLAEKISTKLDMELCIKSAKSELLKIWDEDMKSIMEDTRLLCENLKQIN